MLQRRKQAQVRWSYALQSEGFKVIERSRVVVGLERKDFQGRRKVYQVDLNEREVLSLKVDLKL